MDDFKDISGYFQSVSEDFNSESFKFEDIKDIHDHVQELEENDEHEPWCK